MKPSGDLDMGFPQNQWRHVDGTTDEDVFMKVRQAVAQNLTSARAIEPAIQARTTPW